MPSRLLVSSAAVAVGVLACDTGPGTCAADELLQLHGNAKPINEELTMLQLANVKRQASEAPKASAHSNDAQASAMSGALEDAIVVALREDPCNEESWPSIKNDQVCGACKVLVDDFDSEYGTCDSYCERMGRQCVGAWEEHRNNCEVEEDMTCSEARGTSDAICECARHDTAAAPGYEHIPGACVRGSNLAYYNGEYTPAQCAEICDAEPRCVAFEYVPPGAARHRHRPACRPQSSSNQGNCDGARYGMDLYVKN